MYMWWFIKIALPHSVSQQKLFPKIDSTTWYTDCSTITIFIDYQNTLQYGLHLIIHQICLQRPVRM